MKRRNVYIYRRISQNSRHTTRKPCILNMCTQALAHFSRYFVCMRNHSLEVTIACDQLRSTFRANTWNSRYIIRRIAFEPIKIRNQSRRNPVIQIIHILWRHNRHVRHALMCGHYRHIFTRKLINIAIACKQKRMDMLLFRHLRKRAQYIVTFPTCTFAHRYAEMREQILHHRKLHVQVGIHGWTLRFVLREHVYAYLGFSLIKRADNSIGVKTLHQFDKHVEKSQ